MAKTAAESMVVVVEPVKAFAAVPWQFVVLFVLYFNFFPHIEILGGSQFTLRNFRGVPVQRFDIFYLPKKLVIFRGVPVKKITL